jgi:hypothetical protein
MLFTDRYGVKDVRQIFKEIFIGKNYTLYTKEDLLGIANVKYPLDKKLPLEEAKVAQAFAMFEDHKDAMGSTCGVDKGLLGLAYMKASFVNIFLKDSYDFLGIFDGGRVISFVIPQLGECNLHPNFWSINLICSMSLSGGAAFTLGSTLYCAKKFYEIDGIQGGKVVLELARKYSNVPGLLTYSRLGFVRDPTLFFREKNSEIAEDSEKRRCFADFTNLPMSCDVTALSFAQIKDLMKGILKIDNLDSFSKKIVEASKAVEAAKKQIADKKEQEKLMNKFSSCASDAGDVYDLEVTTVTHERKPNPSAKYVTMMQTKIAKAKEKVERCTTELESLIQSATASIAPRAPAVAAIAAVPVAAVPAVSVPTPPVRLRQRQPDDEKESRVRRELSRLNIDMSSTSSYGPVRSRRTISRKSPIGKSPHSGRRHSSGRDRHLSPRRDRHLSPRRDRNHSPRRIMLHDYDVRQRLFF